jgi:hypothetical protein
MPEPLPPIVKKYKHTAVYGYIPGMQNTGVHLNEGDVYSVFGSGKINAWPSNPDKYKGLVQPGWRTIAKIGDYFYFRMSPALFTGYPLIASRSGNLYLGIEDGKHDE